MKGALGQMTKSSTSLAHRDALITADYVKGIPVKVIAATYGVSHCRVSTIALRTVSPRIAPKSPGGSASVSVYMTKSQYKNAAMAAKKRGLTVGRLLSRLARVTLSDKSLLDNVLDDGVHTEEASHAAA